MHSIQIEIRERDSSAAKNLRLQWDNASRAAASPLPNRYQDRACLDLRVKGYNCRAERSGSYQDTDSSPGPPVNIKEYGLERRHSAFPQFHQRNEVGTVVKGTAENFGLLDSVWADRLSDCASVLPETRPIPLLSPLGLLGNFFQ